MEPVRGKDVTIQFLKNDAYEDYACATDVTISFSLETTQVRTFGDGTWAKPRGRRHSYRISLSGLIVLDEPDRPRAFDILEYLRAMSGIQYRIFFEIADGTLKLIEGVALPVDESLGGGAEGFGTGDIELEGDGNVSIRDAVVNCPSTVTTIEVNAEQTKILITGHTGEPIRYDYSIDGGGVQTAFIFTDPAEIPIPEGTTIGVHDISIWPVCENGDYGAQFDGTFEVEAPPDVCAPPSGIVFSEITETSVHVEWTPPDPAPASGYQWELFDTATGGFVYNDGGVPMIPEADITGLSEGVEYTFRVRSLCGPGLDVSIWIEDTFTTDTDEPPDPDPDNATIDWAFTELSGASGSFLLQVVSTSTNLASATSDNSGSVVAPLEPILARVNGAAGTVRWLIVEDETLGTTIYNNQAEANQSVTFTPIAGHLYSVIGSVRP